MGKGLTTGEVAAHLKEVFGVETGKETVSAITDRVLEGMHEWRHRPLDPVYPVLIIDAVHVKIRDGAVANRPVYVALAVTVHGTREILGIWAGDGGEGAKTWQATLHRDPQPGREGRVHRAVRRAGRPAGGGQPGLAGRDRATLSDPPAAQQLHLRLHARLAGPVARPEARADRGGRGRRRARFLQFTEAWEAKYPAVVKLWTAAWPEVVPYLSFDREIRHLLTSTNAVESLNARLRRVVKASGHFPTGLAALKRLYLAILSLDPTGQAPQRWSNRWKPVLNAFEMTFDGRLNPERDSAAGVKTGDTP